MTTSTRPTREQLASLRNYASNSPTGTCNAEALRALLDDYEARGAALRDLADEWERQMHNPNGCDLGKVSQRMDVARRTLGDAP